MAEPRDRGRLGLAGAAARLARNRATPFYLFEPETAREALRRWSRAAAAGGGADRAELVELVELFYPWKCNRHEPLLRLAREAGWGAEVTAAGDLAAALRLWSGRRVLFQGPAKPGDALDAALAAGAVCVADSPEDADAILARSSALSVTPRYLLRFRAASAEPSQRGFGLAPRDAAAWGARVARAKQPPPEGLAFHLGTGLASPEPFVAAIREAGRLAEGLSALGVAVRVLDVGGGFPARREARRDARGRVRGRPAAPEAFLRAIRSEARRRVPGARLFLEPGRAIASDAFHLVTRVVRASDGRVYVDASRMSHAFFVPRGRHAFRAFPRRPGSGRVEIRGPLPTNLDLFSSGEAVGRPREGDLLVIESVGAYNLIAANAWAGGVPAVVELTGR
jgi:diaminopimelate decarboxylase